LIDENKNEKEFKEKENPRDSWETLKSMVTPVKDTSIVERKNMLTFFDKNIKIPVKGGRTFRFSGLKNFYRRRQQRSV